VSRRLSLSLGARIALASLAVGVVVAAILAGGVLVYGAQAFEQLMVEHGETAAAARAMFERTVTAVFAAAALAALLAATAIALLLGATVARPLRRIGQAARRIARGDYAARAPRAGPPEIESLADTFNHMADQLEDQERIRREFIANAAHELRTPLTNLVGYLEALRDEVVSPDRATFESLREEADRLVRLSRSLDTLAEGYADPRAPPLSELDLVASVSAAVELARPALEKRRIRLERRLPTSLRARANADHVAQVLANLLQNAIRYAPEGGAVTVTAEARSREVVVSVSNDGEPIQPSDLTHVFERFYRVEKSRHAERGGAGIGLAIVRQLVEAGGGQVGAESSARETRFWFSLPM
jgi:signal transduction histidine kinase